MKTTSGKHRFATQGTVIERDFISSEGPKFRPQMVAFPASETRLGTRPGLPTHGSCCQWSLLQWKLYGAELSVESKLALKNCWMPSINPVLHNGLIRLLLQTEFYNKHSSTAWDAKRTIHNLAVAFIRTWEVWPRVFNRLSLLFRPLRATCDSIRVSIYFLPTVTLKVIHKWIGRGAHERNHLGPVVRKLTSG